jgi:hypothetical protein
MSLQAIILQWQNSLWTTKAKKEKKFVLTNLLLKTMVKTQFSVLSAINKME